MLANQSALAAVPHYSYGQVQDVLDNLPATSVNARTMSSGIRATLECLMTAYGHDGLTWRLITDGALRTLYASASNNVAQGAAVALQLANMARPVHNPLLRDPTPAPVPPVQTLPTPTPAPVPTPATPHGVYALRTELDATAERLLADMDELAARIHAINRATPSVDYGAAIEALRDDTALTMQRLTAAIPDTVRAHVSAEVATALKGLTPTVLTIATPATTTAPASTTSLGTVHCEMPKLLRRLSIRKHVYLHGPSGSGKSTAAAQCAVALGLSFHAVAKISDEFSLIGYFDATGKVVRTPFREAYEHGGVFLFDELDGSNPNAVVALNMALANKACPFPDMLVKQHPDFVCIGAGNTQLRGASRQYSGRQELDGASVNRFVFQTWGYDEALERALTSNAAWCKYVQEARKVAAERLPDFLITPRATIDGAELLALGESVRDVLDDVLWKNIDRDTCDQLEAAIRAPLPVQEGII